MPKSAFAIFLATSLVDVSFALQVQPQTDSAKLRNYQGGRTTELEWVWTEEDGETCETACHNKCAGAECDALDRGEIDDTAKLTDLEAEMGTSYCTSYSNSTDSLGPYVSAEGECVASSGSGSCSDAASDGGKLLCPCEIVLGTCTIAEDPHINVFDDAQISLAKATTESEDATGAGLDDELLGEKWLVKSDRVLIQARFEDMSGGAPESKIYTRAVALSGEILNGNVIAVGSLEDPITWNGDRILTDQDSSFYMREGSFFINATRGSSSLVQDPSQENLGVNIRLSSGVSMIVNRLHHYTNVAIRMPQQASGQEGLCGNFNGVGTDDSLDMVSDRFNPTVAPEESLFDGLSFK